MRRGAILIIFIALITFTFSHAYAQESDSGNKSRAVKLFSFAEGIAVTASGGGTLNLIDKAGKIALKIEAHEAKGFADNLCAVRLVNKWGYVDKKGKYTILPQFDEARDFSEGLAPVKQGKAWGVINKKGEVIIDYVYEDLKRFRGGLAPAKANGKWGFVTKNGKFAVKPVYLDAGEFSEGLAPVKTVADNSWGYINPSGKIMIQPMFQNARSFGSDAAPVQIDTKWGYIDKKGSIAVNPQYGDALPFSEGLAAVQTGDKWEYITPKGETALKGFTGASSFASGLALVSKGAEWFYIDKKGKKSVDMTGMAGDWQPPSVALWDIIKGSHFTIYNFSLASFHISTDTKSSYFGQVNNLNLPINTSYALFGEVGNGLSDWGGFINFELNGYPVFRIWLFTYGGHNGITLIDSYGKFGANISGDYWCSHGTYNCKTRDAQMYDKGVKLALGDFNVYITRTYDDCIPEGCEYNCPRCGTGKDPVAVTIVPSGLPMPGPY